MMQTRLNFRNNFIYYVQTSLSPVSSLASTFSITSMVMILNRMPNAVTQMELLPSSGVVLTNVFVLLSLGWWQICQKWKMVILKSLLVLLHKSWSPYLCQKQWIFVIISLNLVTQKYGCIFSWLPFLTTYFLLLVQQLIYR